MATTHPYVSGPGNITQMVNKLQSHFRRQSTLRRQKAWAGSQSSSVRIPQAQHVIPQDGFDKAFGP